MVWPPSYGTHQGPQEFRFPYMNQLLPAPQGAWEEQGYGVTDYEFAEQALRIIKASSPNGELGCLVAGHDKNPVYPGANWQYHGNQLTLDVAMAAWRAWGSCVRGVGIVMRDNFVVMDFDSVEKTREREPEYYESRKGWRERFEQKLLKFTYAERSRGGKGSHFVVRVPQGFTGRRGIELSKKFYAIDVLTGNRYCDITGFRLNELPVANDGGLIEWYLKQMEERHVDTDSMNTVTYEHGTFTAACLAELLDYVRVDTEDYNGWIEIGLALFNETSGSNIGLRLWDEWSQKYGGGKYTSSHDLAYKWGTFKLGRYKYSVGSIIRRAKQGGAKVAQIRLRHKGWVEISGIRTMKVGG